MSESTMVFPFRCCVCDAPKPDDGKKTCSPGCVKAAFQLARLRPNKYKTWMFMSNVRATKLERDKALAQARKDALGSRIE